MNTVPDQTARNGKGRIDVLLAQERSSNEYSVLRRESSVPDQIAALTRRNSRFSHDYRLTSRMS